MSDTRRKYQVSWQGKAQIDTAAMYAGLERVRVWQDENWQWRMSATHTATGERVILGAKTKGGLLRFLAALTRVDR